MTTGEYDQAEVRGQPQYAEAFATATGRSDDGDDDAHPHAHAPTHTHIYVYTLLAGNIDHRPRNANLFCPWSSSPSLSWCKHSLLFLSVYLFGKCFVAYAFASPLTGSM